MPEEQADPAERRPEKAGGYSRTERGRKPPLENLGPRTRFPLWYYLSLLLGPKPAKPPWLGGSEGPSED